MDNTKSTKTMCPTSETRCISPPITVAVAIASATTSAAITAYFCYYRYRGKKRRRRREKESADSDDADRDREEKRNGKTTRTQLRRHHAGDGSFSSSLGFDDGKFEKEKRSSVRSRSRTTRNNNDGKTTTTTTTLRDEVFTPSESASSSDPSTEAGGITFHPIGYVSSVYRLCVGTPRQGSLAPHSRGRVVLYTRRISRDSISELEAYSHIWVVFSFHLNSNARVLRASNADCAARQNDRGDRGGVDGGGGGGDDGGGGGGRRQFPSKVSPPALGGKRVGVFATRTPHRPNPVGFTLCRVDGIDVPNKQRRKRHARRRGEGDQKKNNDGGIGNDNDVGRRSGESVDECDSTTFSIDISGLDLVDGTPVLDIKPYVPHYDSVGYHDCDTDKVKSFIGGAYNNSESSFSSSSSLSTMVRVPPWVSTGLNKRRNVTFTPKALKELEQIVKLSYDRVEKGGDESNRNGNNAMLQFYGPNRGNGERPLEAFSAIKSCIEEVLSADVRSVWQTGKVREGKFRAERTGRVREVVNTSLITSDNVKERDEKVENCNHAGDTTASFDGVEQPGHQRHEQYQEKGTSPVCTQQIDNLLISYTAMPPSQRGVSTDVNGDEEDDNEEETSMAAWGSGVDDSLIVHAVEWICTGSDYDGTVAPIAVV